MIQTGNNVYTVTDLIADLQKCPMDMIVICHNDDDQEWYNATGPIEVDACVHRHTTETVHAITLEYYDNYDN